MPDVFALLMDDHRTVEGLFSQFEQSQDPGVAMQICDELTVHSLLEEELVYPIVATKLGTGLANEARHEHQEAKQLVSQIEAGVAAGNDVSGLVQQLKESVDHHVQEEESELFPKMQEALPGLVTELGDDVVERKQTLQAQLAEARSLGQGSAVVTQKPYNS
ncbi:MAG: hemerythrin domain-containing protein [Acidimicrobiia bacterium]